MSDSKEAQTKPETLQGTPPSRDKRGVGGWGGDEVLSSGWCKEEHLKLPTQLRSPHAGRTHEAFIEGRKEQEVIKPRVTRQSFHKRP